MAKQVSKAMVLCAGLGTRLHPITHDIPKPIVEVLNVPNVLHIFHMLRRAGIKDVIVNLFHLPEKMEAFFKQGQCGEMNISYSKESPLLGTGGGVKKAESFLKGGPFILANCDFVSNVDLKKVMARHFERKATASMVLIADNQRQHLYSKVGVDEQGHLCSLPKLETKKPHKTGIFTGLHVLEDSIFEQLEEKPSGINDVLYPYLMKEKPGSVYADFEPQSFWYDTGDINAIWFATMELFRLLMKKEAFLTEVLQSFGFDYREIKPGIWMDPRTELPRGVDILGPVLLGKGTVIGAQTKIGPYTVIGDGSHIGKGAKISNSILLQKSVVEDSVSIENSLYYLKGKLPAKSLV